MNRLNKLIEKASEVRRATLSHYNIDHIERFAYGYNFLLINKPSSEVGVIWSNAIFECNVLSEASFFLAVHGFYEDACAKLRGIVDGFLTRLYWDILDNRGEIKEWIEEGRSTNQYSQWEMGKCDDYPGLSKNIWPTILSEQLIAEYDKHYRIRTEFDEILKVLNLFVHGRPSSRHYGGAYRSSTINIDFKENHFNEWFGNLQRVFLIVAQLSIIRYPILMDTPIGFEINDLKPETASPLKSFLGSKRCNGAI